MRDAALDLVDAVVFAPLVWLAYRVVLAGGPVWPCRVLARAGMAWRRAFCWLTFKTEE